MELKTHLQAEPGQMDLHITREFDLPVELVFRAHTEASLLSQWMGTEVLKLESEKHGSYQFETKDAKGNVVFRANGVFAEFIPGEKITRTFEMENSPFPVQIEFMEFEKVSEEKSKLKIQMVYRSVAARDQMLKMPFAAGLNMAHNRLQETITARHNA